MVVDNTSDKTASEQNVTQTSQEALLSAVFSPARLPCGRTLQNRLVKVSLYEHMASFGGGPPNVSHLELYARWARGNWGMIMTGNVQVMRDHLSLGRDIVIPEVLTEEALKPFIRLAASMRQGSHNPLERSSRQDEPATDTLAIMQLSHAGRQSPNILGGRSPFVPPLAPSAIALDFTSHSVMEDSAGLGRLLSTAFSSLMHKLVFLTPRAMSQADIDIVIAAFVRGAQLAARSGLDGVELHAGHGYLIAEFISTKTNIRTDEYSAISHPLQFLWRVVAAIRAPGVVPLDFVVGIKLNAADYVDGSNPNPSEQADNSGDMEDEQRVLAHVRDIASWRMVDFIEVSGGTYENPKFMNDSASSRRQALFSRFSRRALTELSHDCDGSRPLVLLTGGLTSPTLLNTALREQHADLLGLGRLSVLYPELPRLMEDARASGKMKLMDALDHNPLAMGQKPWEAKQEKQDISWKARTERALTHFVYSLWAGIPPIARPQFPRLIGAGMEMAWYDVAMRNLAAGSNRDVGDGLGAIVRMWSYIAPGPCNGWTTWIILCAMGIMVTSLLKA